MTDTNDERTRNGLVEYSRLAYQRGLVGAAGGNVSIRLTESEAILITASGVSLRDLTADHLIAVGLDGRKLSGPDHLRPSKESGLHTSIYRAREDVRAVFHLHPTYCTGLSIGGAELPMITVSSRLKLVRVPCISEYPPGSAELAGAIEEIVSGTSREVRSILLGSHGIISFDTCLEDAFDIAELTEETARVAFVHRLFSARGGGV